MIRRRGVDGVQGQCRRFPFYVEGGGARIFFLENRFLRSGGIFAEAGAAESGGVAGHITTTEHVVRVLKQEALANFQKWLQ